MLSFRDAETGMMLEYVQPERAGRIKNSIWNVHAADARSAPKPGAVTGVASTCRPDSDGWRNPASLHLFSLQRWVTTNPQHQDWRVWVIALSRLCSTPPFFCLSLF